MKYNIVKLVNYVLKNNAWSLKDDYIDNIGTVRVFCFNSNLNETTDLNTCFNIFMGYAINEYFYSIDVFFERVIFRISNYVDSSEDYSGEGTIEFNLGDIDTEEKFFQYCLVNDTMGLTFKDIKAILKVQRLIPEEVLNPLND